IGARAVGKATRLFEMMTAYAGERRQFDRPIGEFQMVQQMLADSAIEIEAARLLVLRAAGMIDRGRDAREHISMVKVFAAETLGRVADRAVQVFGGMGYCKDLPVERLYRDARVYRIYDGTSEIHRGVVARGLLKRGAALVDLAV
ncbi:MAG: acyl-CoA dehydrogenase family protein, partial [Rhodospirillales bacterium]